MQVLPTILTRAVALIAAFVVVCLVATGCAPAQPNVIHVVPQTEATYPEVRSYSGIEVLTNVSYGRADDKASKLDICVPDEGKLTSTARPAIIAIHGGSWAFGDKSEPDWRSICQWLATKGYVVASVNYRLAPAHRYPAAIHDVERAVGWLRAPAQVKRFSIDPTLIGAMGGSAGGNLAALLGTLGSGPLSSGHRVAAVAEFSGPTNLSLSGEEETSFIPAETSYLGCRTLTSCPRAIAASPLFNVDPSDPPFFISHSTNELIPLSQAVSFVHRLRASGIDVTFVAVEGKEHSIMTLNAAMRARLLAFFRRTLVHRPFLGFTP